ncbi:MAG: DegT/DnrJ/EryC1/StrS family aminotransferase [Coriobacteriia bacterium]|nr:DegT/DnrJ/EryC1/StrS family aminotransferase [Coriobacteriia bacterium]
MEIKYPLATETWSLAEEQAILEVLKSKQFTMGKFVRKYEEAFAKKFGLKYAVMSNSGSSANLLAIAALCYSGKLSPGDEVIVPAVSWGTTYFPLTQYGLSLRFVDIDIETLNIDVLALESAVTKKTKAVLAVNLLGNPCDFDAIQKVCDRHNLMLIEDNCESMGAEYNEKKAGTFGVAGTFSSFFSHHICTMEGGVTVTNDEELYHYMLCIRAHGWTRQLPQVSSLHKKTENTFYEAFNFIMPGYNLRPIEMEAAIGLEQLKKLDKFVSVRRENAQYFRDIFKDDARFILQKETGRSSWFGFSLILADSLVKKRDKVVGLLQNNGIETRPIVAGNFTKQKALKFMDYSISGSLTSADNLHENGFFVGNNSISIKDQIDLLAQAVKRL